MLSLLALVVGCQAHSTSQKSAFVLPEPPPQPTPLKIKSISGSNASLQKSVPASEIGLLVAQSAPSSKSTANARFGSSSAKSTTPPPLPDGAPQITDEPIDIEARLGILVEDVSRSASQVTALVAQHGGTVTLDLRTEKSSEDAGEARLQVRVPAPRFDSFFDAVTQVGAVRGREIKKRDVELEIHDTDLLLRNLEATMRRYEEILGQAHDVKDVLAIENELNRVRADIDQSKGRLAWLRDRVARATVVIRLYSPNAQKAQEGASFFPGLRATSFVDLREGSRAEWYTGGGISLRFANLWSPGATTVRGMVLDFDIARSCCGSHPENSDYGVSGLIGGDYYSSMLGGGLGASSIRTLAGVWGRPQRISMLTRRSVSFSGPTC